VAAEGGRERTGAWRRDHAVHFYRRDDELVDRLGRYVQRALSTDSAAVVVATPGHLRSLEGWLEAHATDPEAARSAGLLHLLDSRESLGRLMVGDEVDPGRFRHIVGSLIRQAAVGGRAVYVYGEMVALLWAAGQVAATMALEALWNELSQELCFSLLCGYPVETVGEDFDATTLSELCSMHSALFWAPPPLSDAAGAVRERSRIFPHQSDSPRAARRFVSEALRDWNLSGDLVEDVALVVTELTSNALVHAHSDCLVTVSLTGDAVYLAVKDHAPVLPTRRPAGELETSGRGLAMVAAVSRRWGADLLDQDKVVWAELPR
jgi:hypothetical protein